MILEAMLEEKLVGELSALPELSGAQIIGSRLEQKTESAEAGSVVAVASGFRQNDAFSLSPINVPVTITVVTRVEDDARSSRHNEIVEAVADRLSYWHKFQDDMTEALTTRKFAAYELRMDGGSTQTFDDALRVWSDSMNVTIRGAEKFVRPTVVTYTDGTTDSFDIAGAIEDGWVRTPWNVRSVSIGNEVTAVGWRSFTGFGQLSSIVVPKNVAAVGGEAFSYTGLANVVIEDGVAEIGYGAFAYSNSLSSVALPNTLTKIGADVFEECGGLSSVAVPKSVDDISHVAFRYSRLSAVTMEERTKAEAKELAGYPWGLENGCVIHCADGDIVVGAETVVQYKSGLTRYLDIEGQLTYRSIPSVVYAKEVVVGNAVTSIGEGAFEQCSNLTNVNIPGSVKTIGDAAFLGCTALTSLAISEGVETIEGSAFTNCRSLSNIVIPSSVTSIGDEAFFSCEALYNVTFIGKDKATVQGMDNYSWRL